MIQTQTAPQRTLLDTSHHETQADPAPRRQRRMRTTLDTPRSKKPREPLDKLFNVLFTETMYARLESYSSRFGISKGALIREALEGRFQTIDDENALEH